MFHGGQNTRRKINVTGPQPPQIMPYLLLVVHRHDHHCPLSFSSAASAAPTVLLLSW
jgi:hypothetical protein